MDDANDPSTNRPSTNRLSGRMALVTGASSGIGRSVAKALAAEGAAVALSARRADRLEALRSEIEAAGGTAVVVPADLSDREAVRSLIDRAVDALGGLDLLVNNAGTANWDFQGVVEADLDQWLLEIDVNLTALMMLTHAAARRMVEEGGGDIVNISSMASRARVPYWLGYQTSKAAATTFSMLVQRGLHDRGVRVTTIEPGEVATPIQPEEDLARMRMLEPEDVADALIYVVTRPPHVKIPELQIAPMP